MPSAESVLSAATQRQAVEAAVFAGAKDFRLYAQSFLEILGKGGESKALKLNRAQVFLHDKLEALRAETGRVRAIVLKGRQQGCCFAPHHRVLMADLSWRPIGKVGPGDRVVAVDESVGDSGVSAGGKAMCRRYRVAVVEAVARLVRPVVRVKLASGRELVVTPEHRMLFRQRGGDLADWRAIGRSKVGDVIRSAFRGPPGELTYEDGWFAGIIDGEGCRSSAGDSSLSVAVYQAEGAVLDRARAYLNRIGVGFTDVADRRKAGASSKLGAKVVHSLEIGRLADVVYLMNRCDTSRFRFDGDELAGRKIGGNRAGDDVGKMSSWDEIVSIEDAGTIEVVDLQTSAKTYIVEGLVSHNSTYVQARFRWRLRYGNGLKAYVLAHEQKASDNLFAMAKRYQDRDPMPPSIGASNAKELWFDKIDCRYEVATAGTKDVGRSGTAQLFHGSEYAYWAGAEDHWAGIGQTVPDLDGTEIIIESTANGVAGDFYRRWKDAINGKGDFRPIFIPWFWQEEYRRPVPKDWSREPAEEELVELYGLTDEQLVWRRAKIETDFGGDVTKFQQEYPCNWQEAFVAEGRDTFITGNAVLKAQATTLSAGAGAMVVGVDPARYGDDKTAIVVRQGRKVRAARRYEGKSTMEVAGLVARFIVAEKPDRVNVDVIGIGAGVYDRLVELGYGPKDTGGTGVVHAVNAAERAIEDERFVNRRAECWATMKEWLLSFPCSLPEGDGWLADLTAPGYTYDSSGRLRLESKEKMRDRGEKSPDLADALSLTFADPVQPIDKEPQFPMAPAETYDEDVNW